MEGNPGYRSGIFLGVVLSSALLAACGGGGGGAGAYVPQASSGGSSSATPQPVTISQLPIVSDSSASTSGVFVGADCGPNAVVSCPNFATTFRHGIALGTTYVSWSQDLGQFISQQSLASWVQQGIIPQITWMPDASVTYTGINGGAFDAYITQSADELKQFGSTIFLRPFHEFNGNWYPYGLANQGADTAADTAFISAWRRVYTIFQQQGATNVKFVWCFNNASVPSASSNPWNNPANAYPGDAYVDWIAFDMFNQGSMNDGKAWQSFQQIINTPYSLAVSISSVKPIMIAEMASNEYGDNGTKKGSWISGMLSLLSGSTDAYPNVKLISWFEGDPNGYIYNSESSEAAYSAWVNGIRMTSANGTLNFRSSSAGLAAITTP
jgi:hypothetical protein